MLPPLFGWWMVEKFLHNKKTATISMPSDIESHSLFHLIHRRSAVPLPLRGEGLRSFYATPNRRITSEEKACEDGGGLCARFDGIVICHIYFWAEMW